jgi:hypothetical protein
MAAPPLLQHPWASYLAVDQRGRVAAQPLPTPQALRTLEQQGRVHNLGGGWVMPVSSWGTRLPKLHKSTPPLQLGCLQGAAVGLQQMSRQQLTQGHAYATPAAQRVLRMTCGKALSSPLCLQ